MLFFHRLRRPAGRMTVEEQHLEGEYRYVNSRLLTNRYSDEYSISLASMLNFVSMA